MSQTLAFVISKTGIYTQNSIQAIDLSSNGLFQYDCQLWLAFYGVLDGQGEPDPSTIVTTGLSGTFECLIYPSFDSKAVTLSGGNTIDLAGSAGDVLQWQGVVDKLIFNTTNIVGCNYIKIYLARK